MILLFIVFRRYCVCEIKAVPLQPQMKAQLSPQDTNQEMTKEFLFVDWKGESAVTKISL